MFGQLCPGIIPYLYPRGRQDIAAVKYGTFRSADFANGSVPTTLLWRLEGDPRLSSAPRNAVNKPDS